MSELPLNLVYGSAAQIQLSVSLRFWSPGHEDAVYFLDSSVVVPDTHGDHLRDLLERVRSRSALRQE